MVFFFALLVYFLATVLLTNTTQSLRATRWQADRTRARYLAIAAVNQALVRLRTDSTFESRTREAPYRVRQDKFEAVSWVEKDEEHPEILFVHGAAWPVGNPSLRQDFVRSVLRKLSTQGIVYTRVMPYYEAALGLQFFDDHRLLNNIFVGATTDTEWTRVPPCPRRFHGRNGQIIERPGLFAFGIYGMAADDRGNLYACYDAWNDEGAPAYQASYRANSSRDYDEFVNADLAEEMKNSFLEPAPIFTETGVEPGAPVQPTSLVRFDPIKASWELMPRLPEVFFDSRGQKLQGDPLGVYDTMASDGTDVLMICNRPGPDFMLRFDTREQSFTTVPPAPNLTYAATGKVVDRGGLAPRMYSLAAGRDGSLYANFGSSQSEQVVGRYDPQAGSWRALPSPPHQAYDDRGRLVDVPRLRFGRMAVEASGDLCVVVRASADGKNLLDTIWRHSQGKWTSVPPFPEQQEVDGAMVATGKLNRRIDRLTVDVEGNLLVKTVHDEWVPETTFKLDRQGKSTVLPGLSDHSVVDETGKTHPYPPVSWKPRPFQHDLCGSGTERPGDDSRYVPVASF